MISRIPRERDELSNLCKVGFHADNAEIPFREKKKYNKDDFKTLVKLTYPEAVFMSVLYVRKGSSEFVFISLTVTLFCFLSIFHEPDQLSFSPV